MMNNTTTTTGLLLLATEVKWRQDWDAATVCIALGSCLLSLLLVLAIKSYLKSKPPGEQTQMDIANLFFFDTMICTAVCDACVRVVKSVFQDPGLVIARSVSIPGFISLLSFFSSVSANAILQFMLIRHSQDLDITDYQLGMGLNYGLPSFATLILVACMACGSSSRILLLDAQSTIHRKHRALLHCQGICGRLLVGPRRMGQGPNQLFQRWKMAGRGTRVEQQDVSACCYDAGSGGGAQGDYLRRR